MRTTKTLLKIFLPLLLTLTSYLASAPVVSAHTLKTDGSIGAVLHIDPEDDPVVGQPAYFFFEFKDTTNKFNPQNCTCTVNINENKQLLNTETLASDSSLTTASFNYTFPQKGVYQVEVVGTANDSSFQDFKLTYDIRVDRTSSEAGSSSNNFFSQNLPLIAIGLVIIFLVLVTLLNKRKTKNTPLKGTGMSCFLLGLGLLILFQYGQLQQFLPVQHQHDETAPIHQVGEHLPCCSHPIANIALTTTITFKGTTFNEPTTYFVNKQSVQTISPFDPRSPPLA